MFLNLRRERDDRPSQRTPLSTDYLHKQKVHPHPTSSPNGPINNAFDVHSRNSTRPPKVVPRSAPPNPHHLLDQNKPATSSTESIVLFNPLVFASQLPHLILDYHHHFLQVLCTYTMGGEHKALFKNVNAYTETLQFFEY